MSGSRKTGSTGPGSGRSINLRSTREVIGLIRLLEAQGCTVKWGGGTGGKNGRASQTEGSFPAKVYPPDPTKHFILFHGSVSDTNAATLKRNEVRRAGLYWPGDLPDSHRIAMTATKEAPVSNAEPVLDSSIRKAGEHLVVPPQVAAREYPPLREHVEAFKDAIAQLPETFWSDEALGAARAKELTGFAGSSGMSKVQQLLDWTGYRVIETRKNRGGKSYRWWRDPDAPERTDYGTPPGGRTLRAVPPLAEEKPANSKFEVFQRGTAAYAKHEERAAAVGVKTMDPLDKLEQATIPPLPAEAGPIAAAFAAAQERKVEDERKHKHERVMCSDPDCVRWFTPEGLAHHQEETGHGLPVKAEIEESTLLVARSAIEGSEQRAAQEEDPRDEAAEWRALIEEAEAETARVRAQLAAVREGAEGKLANLRDELAAVKAERERQAALITNTKSERDALRHDYERVLTRAEAAEAARDEAIGRYADAKAPDGSWVIPWEQVGQQWTNTIVENARQLGVKLELRGRHA